MDPATCETSTKKHNLCHVFSSWKISRALKRLTLAQTQLQSKVNMIDGKRRENMHQTKVTWLAEAKNLLLHAEILKTEMNDAKQFLIWKQPHGLSNKFSKMTTEIQKKLEDADKPVAEAIGHTVKQKDNKESSSSLSLPTVRYGLSKSRMQAASEIMEAFQDNDIKLIGLVGMGHVGKTNLAMLMGMKAKESGMFDAVIKASGRSSKGFKPDQGVIRSDIAKALDSKWNAEEVGEDSSRASKLIGEIVKKVEKILIILEDVWEVIDLKAIGIPLGEDHKGCKILLTTCLRHVCQGFSCQKIIHLRESYELEKYYIIPDVANENKSLKLNYDYLNDKKMQSLFLLCSHFPMKYAPTIEELTRYGIGQGLFEDYESIESARKEAHLIVSSFRSSLIVEEEEDCIKMCDQFRMLALGIEKPAVSFKNLYKAFFRNDLLENEKAKIFACSTTMFLQTSQFPGYKFFGLKFSNLHILTIIEDDNGADFYKDRIFSSSPHMEKLNVLCLQASHFPCGDWALNPPSLSLEGIENLTDLQTLQIKGYKVKGVSSLVKLNKLKILGFLGCTFEDKLPDGLRELHNLKILDFSYCVGLHEQPQDWILKLSKLEELYITDVSLELWSRSGFLQHLQEHNRHLSLIVLSPKLNSTFRSRQFVVPKFASYRIELINTIEEKVEFTHFKPISASKALRIKALPMSPFVELFKDVEYLHLDGCKDLKYLIDEERIGGDLVEVCAFSKLTNLELVGLAKLKSLWKGGGQMVNLENLKNFQLRDCGSLQGYIFSKLIAQSLKQLEILEVSGCECLEAVLEQCSDGGPVCLPKLTTVKISGFGVLGMSYVFPSYVTEGLTELRELQVSGCWNIQHIFISSNTEVDEKNEPDCCCHLKLPQLRLLVLQELLCLKTFCEGKDFIAAPLLEELQVEHCCNLEPFTLTLNNGMLPRLKKLCLQNSNPETEDEVKAYMKMSKESTRLHFIIRTRPFDSLGTYFLSNLKELKLETCEVVLWNDSTINGIQNLTHLSLSNCPRLEYLFTPTSIHGVPHLKSLRIKGCPKLRQIVAEDETTIEGHGQQHRPTWFPDLTDIDICNCPSLSDVFPARLADQLPKLKRLQVAEAESLTQIFGSDRDSKETSNSMVVQLLLLQNLILKELMNMVRFAPEGLHFTFPALNHLEVRNCTKMQTSFYAVGDQGACAITESEEIRRSAMDYAQLMNAPVAMPILSGNNYEPWRNKMMTYFKSQDLWEVVAQRIKAPLRDAQALFVIQNAVLDPIYSNISGATSARDAWLTLEKIYSNVDDPYIRKLFSGNEQETKRWSTATRLQMDGDNNILWPDGRSASDHEKHEIIVDLRDPDGLRALDLI